MTHKRLPSYRSVLADKPLASLQRAWSETYSNLAQKYRLRERYDQRYDAMDWSTVDLDAIVYARMPAVPHGAGSTEIFVMAVIAGIPLGWPVGDFVQRGYMLRQEHGSPKFSFQPRRGADSVPCWHLQYRDLFYLIPSPPADASEEEARAHDREHRKIAVIYFEHQLAGHESRKHADQKAAYLAYWSPDQQLARAEARRVAAMKRLTDARNAVASAEHDLSSAVDELVRLRATLGNVVSMQTRKEA